ncbi:MAG TPA: lysophospholipid acyltransferase family protein [candidate division Zixibacteria bacterium]
MEFAAVWLLWRLANALPVGLSDCAGRGVGRLVGILWRARRHIAQHNLSRAFPDLSRQETSRIARAAFANVGQTVFEVLRFGRNSTERIIDSVEVEVDGLKHLEQAADNGRGALLMSAHLGNWELLGAWASSRGYALDIVVKPMRNPLTDALYNAQRSAHDIGLIRTQVGTLGIARALGAKRFVALLADQYAGREGVAVEFFGRSVSTPRGPAALALRFGCPILTGVLVRRPHRPYLAVIDPAIPVTRTGDETHDVTALTQAFTARIESYVRRWPEQWLWTHRRWRD